MPITIHPEVEDALNGGTPVVALETAVVTHGLPRRPVKLPEGLALAGWSDREPANLALARSMHRIVRDGGATPAMIGIVRGELCIGLDDDEVASLARAENPEKCAIHNLASVMASGGDAGTTVSATLAACRLTHRGAPQRDGAGVVGGAGLHGIRVFATGGIGGVHRNWNVRPDVSADLLALARTPVCVVCSGAKSILDLPATLEVLETQGVPVIGYRTDNFPQFQSEGNASLRLGQRAECAHDAAEACVVQWGALGLRTSVVLANAVDSRFAVRRDELETAIERAERDAGEQKIVGGARTPFLLDRVASLTDGRSLWANLALLASNAKLAAEVAVELSRHAGRT